MSDNFYGFWLSQNNSQVQIFRSENFFSKKLHIVQNNLFLSPTGSLKFIKFSGRFAIQPFLRVNSLRTFSVLVFVILKISLVLVSFVCTCGSLIPLFSSFRAFETSNRSLSWINIGSGIVFNSRSWLLYSVSFSRYPFDIFWNLARNWISVLPAVKHLEPYSKTDRIKDLYYPNFTGVFTFIAIFRLYKSINKTLLGSSFLLQYAVPRYISRQVNTKIFDRRGFFQVLSHQFVFLVSTSEFQICTFVYCKLHFNLDYPVLPCRSSWIPQ